MFAYYCDEGQRLEELCSEEILEEIDSWPVDALELCVDIEEANIGHPVAELRDYVQTLVHLR